MVRQYLKQKMVQNTPTQVEVLIFLVVINGILIIKLVFQ